MQRYKNIGTKGASTVSNACVDLCACIAPVSFEAGVHLGLVFRYASFSAYAHGQSGAYVGYSGIVGGRLAGIDEEQVALGEAAFYLVGKAVQVVMVGDGVVAGTDKDGHMLQLHVMCQRQEVVP